MNRKTPHPAALNSGKTAPFRPRLGAKQKTNYLAALDLGSSKTRALVAELLDEGEGAAQLRFRGFGEADSQGWHKGAITDLEELSRSVKAAMERAEKMSGVPLESAVVGVGGPQIRGAATACGLTLSSRPRELTRADVRRVMETARDIPLSNDREILHLVPEEFIVDSQKGIRDPIGMQSSRLGVKAHIISGSATATSNVVTAVNRAGILVETTVFEAFAVAEEVLSDEERELGALVAVLGGGSCDMVLYRQGTLRLAGVVPIGGDHFTNDVALGLHTPFRDAEVMKKTFGSVLSELSKDGSMVEVPGLGDRQSWFAPSKTLCQILESRAEELFGMILEQVSDCGMERQLGGGVILCGGGARLNGMCDLAEKILKAPARLGLPPKILDLPESLDSPEYATIVGLLLYALRLWRLRNPAEAPNLGSRWKRLLAGRA